MPLVLVAGLLLSVAGSPVQKDIAQPVMMYQNSEEYRVWAQQASDQYAQLITTLGIETKSS